MSQHLAVLIDLEVLSVELSWLSPENKIAVLESIERAHYKTADLVTVVEALDALAELRSWADTHLEKVSNCSGCEEKLSE